MSADALLQKLHQIFSPPGKVLAVLTPVSALLLFLALGGFGLPAFLQYLSYLLSAYTFGALCYSLFPPIGRRILSFLSGIPLISLYMTDIRFHVSAGLYVSQLINLIYAVWQFSMGIRGRSVWYLTMGFYYGLLFLMRVYLLIYLGRHTPGEDRRTELKKSRFCGVLMTMLNTVLMVMILLIIQEDHYTAHNMIIVIAMATFSFAMLAMTLVHLAQYRKYHSPVFTATVNVSLAASLISMLNLECTMLITFGEGDQTLYNRYMTGGSGALFCAVILLISVTMIRSASKELSLPQEAPAEKQDI